jgi:hypothetical protein
VANKFVNKKSFVIAGLVVCISAGAILYAYLSQEHIVYENTDLDGHGFRVAITCRPDEGFTYYPYLIIKTPRGFEVSRSQVNVTGYEALQACRQSYPVVKLELTGDKSAVRIHFNGRNAFGDLDTLDLPVNYFSPR